MLKASDKRLRDLLVARGVLSRENAERAMDLASPKEGPGFIDVLLSRDFAEEAALLQAMADETGWGVEAVEDAKPAADALALIKQETARELGVLPLRIENGTLVIAVSERCDAQQLEDLRLLVAREVRPVLAFERRIQMAIHQAYGQSEPEETLEEMLKDLGPPAAEPEDDEDAPIVKLTNGLLLEAVREGASHLHIDVTKGGLTARYRIDGRVQSQEIPLERPRGVISRLKIMATLDLANRQSPQDGRIELKVGDQTFMVLCATMPTGTEERVVLTFEALAQETRPLQEMGAPPDVVTELRTALTGRRGLVLLGTHDGLGNASLLRSALLEAGASERVVIGVTNPGSPPLPDGILRVESGDQMTPGMSLRAAARQDADLTAVEDLTDPDTLHMALTLAAQNTAVAGPFKASDPESAVRSMIEKAGADEVADGLAMILFQHALRRLCPECRKKGDVGFTPGGCPACVRGYRGEVLLYRSLTVEPAHRDRIRQGEIPDWPGLKEIAGAMIEEGTVAHADLPGA